MEKIECEGCSAFVIKRNYCLYFSNSITEIKKCPIIQTKNIGKETTYEL